MMPAEHANRLDPGSPPPSRGKRRAGLLARARAARRARAAVNRARSGANDRGTVLLMILGVLALMAIIAVVYASIGKGDRVSSAAVVRVQRLDDQADQIAQYLADIIGRDVFATYAQEDMRRAGDSRSTIRLEAFDAPGTDEMMVSQRDDTDGAWQTRQRDGFYDFNPEGTYARAWRNLSQASGQPANRRDPRSPSDPYLASTEPTFINRGALAWGSWREYGPDEDYLNLRDWAHISNFAPSGNFVNLWALRNNFRAEPGFRVDGSGRPRMSSRLTLINPDTGFSWPAANANQDPDAGFTGPMRIGDLSLNRSPRLNRPADWTMNQIGLFRTVYQPAESNTSPYGVDDPEFLDYQYADADGDGFYDSRWFELIDISDPNNSRPVIAANGRARLFVAARGVDLTGLVNVNTACDFQFEPKRVYVQPDPANTLNPFNTSRNVVENSFLLPAGLTPADVDLQRLLRLTDVAGAYRFQNQPAAYKHLPQPLNNSGIPGDYSAYDPQTQSRNQVIGNAAYQAIWEARERNTLAPDTRFADPLVADAANINGNYPFTQYLQNAYNRFAFYENLGARQDPGRTRTSGALNRYGGVFDEADELELRTYQGLNDPTRTSRLESTVAGRVRNVPALYDLSPLRDNRPAVLERAGRDLPPRDLNNTAPAPRDEYRRALLAVQLDVRRLITTLSGARPIVDNVRVTLDDAAPTSFSEANGTLRLDGTRLVTGLIEPGNFRFAGVPATLDPCTFRPDFDTEDTWDDIGYDENLPATSPRPWFEAAVANQLPPNTVTPPVGRVDRRDQANYSVSRLDLMREAFRAYADCLMPYTQFGSNPQQPNLRDGPFPAAWDPTDATVRHLAYGGNPEIAYRMAAHMALNLRDMLDRDRLSDPNQLLVPDAHKPTAVSLDLTPQAATAQRDRYFPWPRLNLENRFDPASANAARARLSPDPTWIASAAPGNSQDPGANTNPNIRRANLFGIEPQPFLVQTTAMAMFVDTPPTSGTPDSDDEAAGATINPNLPPLDPPPNITINTKRCIGIGEGGCTADNPDFLCYLIAFTVSNPFDVDIELEPSDPSRNDQWYYLQYAQRYYRLVPQDASTLDGMKRNLLDDDRILRAGQTKTFYATYPNSLRDISRRFQRAREALAVRFGNPPPLADDGLMERLAKHEFGEDCVHVAPMYPETGYAIGAPNANGLTNVDLFAIPSPDSPNSIDVPTGPNGEAEQKTFPSADPQRADSRRVVYLWRVMRDPDSVDGDANDGRPAQLLSSSVRGNYLGNDLMLDRLRDPSDPNDIDKQDGELVNALVRPFPGPSTGSSNLDVPGTEAGPDEPGLDPKDNTGFAFISWVAITRPNNPPRQGLTGTANPPGAAPLGALPPWCMEAKRDNIYTPGYRTEPTEPPQPTTRIWSLNAVRGLEGIGTKTRFENGTGSYYESLSDLVQAHASTNPAPGAGRYVDENLSQQFADRRGGTDQPATGGSTNYFRLEHSMAYLDELRAATGAESPWFGNAMPKRFEEAAVQLHHLPPDATGSTTAQATPPRALFSRVGDFLLPLAIGPWQDPHRRPSSTVLGRTPTQVDLLEAQWTTLSEAIALAADYYSGPKFFDLQQDPVTGGGRPSPAITGGAERNIFYKFGRDTRGRLAPNDDEFTLPLADRGQLVLDAWAPYLDYNERNSDYRWDRLNPGDPASLRATRDAPLGNGIPLALNILDKFRVSGLPAETRAKPSDPFQCNSPYPRVGNSFAYAGRTAAYGSATRAEPGRININTAPTAVLRLLPLLSPSRDLLDPGNPGVFDSWLFDGRYANDDLALSERLDLPTALAAANPPVPAPPAGPVRLWNPDATAPGQQPWDIAVSLIGYRDQIALDTRRFNNQDPIRVNFRDDRDQSVPNPTRSGRDESFMISSYDRSQGGLRDQRGFKSVGEVMAVVINNSTDPAVISRAASSTPATANRPNGLPAPDIENSMTRLAGDGATITSAAIDPASFKQDRAYELTTNPGALLKDGANEIPDDYSEKLAIANAILNTITVRSDFFCVWFIINGYTPEDVQVDDGAPMIPSVARRYVMVVDRSNVTTPTTKPRIVMLREVPMP